MTRTSAPQDLGVAASVAELASPVLRIENARIYFEGTNKREPDYTKVIDGLDLAIQDGEAVGVFGASGAGKTSLGYALLGVASDKPGVVGGVAMFRGTTATVDLFANVERYCSFDEKSNRYQKQTVAWRRNTEATLSPLRGTQICLAIQGAKTALNPFRTIRRQFEEAIGRTHCEPAEAEERISELFDSLKLVEEHQDKYPHELSGGMCQRALLGVALCLDPLLLVADEPTTGLDPSLQSQIIRLLSDFRAGKYARQCVDRPRSLLLISHDLNVMRHLADKIMVLSNGKKVDEGPVERIMAGDGVAAATRQLLGFLPDTTTDSTKEPTPINDAEMRAASAIEPILRLESVNYAYPLTNARSGRTDESVLRNATLDVFPGEIVALMGESGSGKTTLARLVLRLLPGRYSGTIVLRLSDHPKPLSLDSLKRDTLTRFRLEVQMIFQNADASLNPGMQASEVLREAIRLRVSRRRERNIDVESEVDNLLSSLELQDRGNHYPATLSGGQKRRLAILRALAIQPSLIIADEPFESLDAVLRSRLYEIINAECRTHRTSFLVITHSLSVAESLCHKIAFMENGEIVEVANASASKERSFGTNEARRLAAHEDFLAGQRPKPPV